jgi:cyclohexadienyl dehydratase
VTRLSPLITLDINVKPENAIIRRQLATNAADVMSTDTTEIRYQTQKAYLLPRADSALQQYVNQWLSRAQTDGTYAALSRAYLGQVVGP